MNTELRKKTKFDVENIFFKLMNNTVLGKTIDNERKHRDVKLVKAETRRNYLVLELKYHKIKIFSGNLLAIEMKRTQILMNKPVYLGLPVFELNKVN